MLYVFYTVFLTIKLEKSKCYYKSYIRENTVLTFVEKASGMKEPTQFESLLLKDYYIFISQPTHSSPTESLLHERRGPQHWGNQGEKAFI